MVEDSVRITYNRIYARLRNRTFHSLLELNRAVWEMKEVAEYAPLNQILLETDCPYMAPVPNRGKRNSSLYLPEVVKTIAEIKGISCEEVVAVTESNALKVLGLI